MLVFEDKEIAFDGLRLCKRGRQLYWENTSDMGGWSQVLLAKIIRTDEYDDSRIIMCKKALTCGIASR